MKRGGLTHEGKNQEPVGTPVGGDVLCQGCLTATSHLADWEFRRQISIEQPVRINKSGTTPQNKWPPIEVRLRWTCSEGEEPSPVWIKIRNTPDRLVMMMEPKIDHPSRQRFRRQMVTPKI